MSFVTFCKKHKVILGWIFFTVFASFIPVFCRLLASRLSDAKLYDNFDILYAGLGLNLATVNNSLGKTSDESIFVIAGCSFLILIIGVIIGILYTHENITVSDSIKFWAIVFSNSFTFVSLVLSYISNKYVI